MSRRCSTTRITEIIRQVLLDGHDVDIEGFGTFHPVDGGFEFEPEGRPRIFLAYVRENSAAAGRLFHDLEEAGYRPWLDTENLLPGQNWARSIQRAIEDADFVIPCFSKKSVLKRGGFQSELRFAMLCAANLPLDDVFLIPVRLEDCGIPERIEKLLHHVDLFPFWEGGLAKVRRTVEMELARKRKIKAPRAR
jgi:hypothetical protein